MTGSRNLSSHIGHDLSRLPQPFAAVDVEAARRYEAWYETPAGRQMATSEEDLLAPLLGHLPDARSVLEVGSGTGHFARWLAGRGLSVTGLDFSPAMLAVARELGGPAYVAGSAESLPFSGNSFDIVALITSLEFTASPLTVLREASSVAHYGLLLGVLNAASLLGISRTVRARFHPSPYRNARFYTPWGLVRLIRLALGDHVQSIICRTTLWPGWVPQAARRLPFGGFVGALVRLSTNRHSSRR